MGGLSLLQIGRASCRERADSQDGNGQALLPHVLETMNLPGYVTSEVICSTVHAHHDVFAWPHDTFIQSYIVKVTQLCPTLCDSMDCSMPGFPVLHYLPEFAQTHVY